MDRTNPFFGVDSFTVKLTIFLAIFLMIYLLAVALFKNRIQDQGRPVSEVITAMIMVLSVSMIAAFVCFSEYTWPSNWCVDICVEGSNEPPNPFGLIGWHWVGLGAVGAFVLLVVLKLVTGTAPSTQSNN